VWWLWLNRFVREINEDGTNYTLWLKWFGEAPMPSLYQAAAEELLSERGGIALVQRNTVIPGRPERAGARKPGTPAHEPSLPAPRNDYTGPRHIDLVAALWGSMI
jgi:hypothetical protein